MHIATTIRNGSPLLAAGLMLLLNIPLRTHAQLAPPPQVGPSSAQQLRASEAITGSVEAMVGGDAAGALALADQAVAADGAGPWGHYMRAVALLALKRVDEAIAAFRDAETHFHSDAWGKSVAIWGQANAAHEARPCRDAQATYERYVQLVAPLDAKAAEMGRSFASLRCPTPAPAPYAMLDPAWVSYRSGDALKLERRYDDAVAAYKQAEQRLPSQDAWGRSIAIWGQAFALKEAGRCKEAAPIFQRYAQYVEAKDPESAALARRYALQPCVPPRK